MEKEEINNLSWFEVKELSKRFNFLFSVYSYLLGVRYSECVNSESEDYKAGFEYATHRLMRMTNGDIKENYPRDI